MGAFFGNLFSPLSRLRKQADDINKIEAVFSPLSSEDFRKKSEELKTRIRQKEAVVSEILPEAFALVREAARRTLSQRHFDVQLMGGIALFEGSIIEMGTGEGKTLAATAPAYLHALSGESAHIITVNDYLAMRDAVWMGQIFHLLGVSTSCIAHNAAYIYDSAYTHKESQNTEGEAEARVGESALLDEERDATGSFRIQREYLKPISRKEAYEADIVYGTNHEFGFDYLRDNLAYAKNSQVQRGHSFAIIDEADSILIDEARTPLIISAPDTQAAEYYKIFSRIAATLKKEEDFIPDEKARLVQITDAGISKVEKALGVENLYDPQNARMVHYLEECLKAHALFSRDRHYVIKNGEVVIVDEFTGRLMHGRRYSGGLHQAIEAKEGVKVQEEARTFAQITIQNYFRLYKKISGMTGTAKTSSEEFHKVYGLEVMEIPPHRPRVRKDLSDLIFKSKEIKYGALEKRVKEAVDRGQPVLLGTTSIDENELLSARFSRAGIRHEILNAKNHEREAEIIAQAGKSGAVMLATNMAGRGVDIILGGNPQDPLDAQKVRDVGGLLVLGTQRNEARRIDNQLRGRSGRQGDPGETQFFLSLEDDLLRIFGGDRVKSLMTRFNLPEDMPIESSMVMKVVEEAQKKVEGINFDIRKHLLEYDDVLNRQRKAMYKKRQNILERLERGELKGVVGEITLSALSAQYREFSRISEGEPIRQNLGKDEDGFSSWLFSVRLLDDKNEVISKGMIDLEEGKTPEFVERKIEEAIKDPQCGLKILASLDLFWTNHLENLEALAESVRMRAYGQKDPLVEYKRESFDMFKTLIINAELWVVANIFKQTQTNANNARPNVGGSSRRFESNQPQSAISSKAERANRNDPCPCGAINPNTGKVYKYKRCGLISAPHHISEV